ncbi:multidrug ABC transporter permease [Catellatospora sp. TT07R-123]|uniref:ABC transporter ATP-binding protein n=1 Tax=Catellatospora sp. TT07R-123 TaxID=2733863 RepID=UPI001B20D7B2|nr:ABC transporter ATP-binding protein [Catellatospora sp. TT07R-123]GHJ43348.1 multidrug ABC transporter permease [Catellatospora sp. TT07R-123]
MGGLTAVAGAGPVWLAWLTADLLDGAAVGSVAPLAAVSVAAVGVVLAALPHLNQYLAAELDRSLSLTVQDGLFSALNRHTGLARLEDPSFQDTVQIAGSSGRLAPSRVVSGALGMAAAAVALFGFLGSLIALSPAVAAAVIAAAVPGLLLHLRLSRRYATTVTSVGHAERRRLFYARLMTTAESAKEVQLFGLGDFFRSRMLDELSAINTAERRIDRRRLAIQVFVGSLAAAVAGSGLVWLTRSGSPTVGDLSVFLVAVAGVQAALGNGVQQVASTHQALLVFEHYATATAPVGADQGTTAAAPLRRGIEIKDVWFRYSGATGWVFRRLNLSIPSGSATALVGLNGAGKSTLVKLLCRFYEPTRGTITWDGVDLRDLDPASLRRRISAVFQDFCDYDLPARENVALGDLSALHDPARVEAAARLAGVHDTLTGLPFGYETPLTRLFWAGGANDPREGVQLSGGQWQRVALARSFMRTDSDLAILDEPSSGLDADAEASIQRALQAHRRGRTTILISHRLNTVRDADTIAVLDGGRVAEQGDHDDLMAARGIYATLFETQAAGYQAMPA